ncbi:hypothetical protein RRR41_001041 [Salmonella enterica]|nr:hypothetical protein [Salmonella enterica]
MSEQRTPPSRLPQGPIGWLLSLIGQLIGLVIGALVLRLMLELAGLYFWWPQEGSRHVHVVILHEITDLDNISNIVQLKHRNEKETHPEIILIKKPNIIHELIKTVPAQWAISHTAIYKTLIYSLYSCVLRIYLLTKNIPFITLMTTIAIIDGFVIRKLLQLKYAPKSFMLFKIKTIVTSTLTKTIIIVYYSSPFYIHYSSLTVTWLIISLFSRSVILSYRQTYK